jgi:lipoate-protein ligase A
MQPLPLLQLYAFPTRVSISNRGCIANSLKQHDHQSQIKDCQKPPTFKIAFKYNTRMTDWRLLITPPAHGAWNMAVDESILEHIGRGASIPTLRLYAWTPACLSLGHAQPIADVDMQRLRQHGWEIVRRATGGRAILHTDELTYSVIAPADEPRVEGSVLESYNRLAQALVRAVQSLNLPVEIKETISQASSATNPVCFEVPSTYEITVNGKKLIGSAQARKRDGVLQHGSLPLTGDLTRICQGLVFENETARDHASLRLLERATTVESALGRAVSWEEAAQAFIQAFEAQLGLSLKNGELSESELKRADELVRQKYDHPSWTERT